MTTSPGGAVSLNDQPSGDAEIEQITMYLKKLTTDKRVREDLALLANHPFKIGDRFHTPGTVKGEPLTVTALQPRSVSAFDPRLGGTVRVPLSIAVAAD